MISALCIFYNVKNWHTIVNCGNQGVINISERNPRRTQPGSSCAEILQNVWNTRNKMRATIKYQHIDGHMAKYLLWQHISLGKKINVMCNSLAKHAVSRVIRSGMKREGKQLLPSEDALVFVNNRELMRELEKTV